jgi:hypothetical protein
MKNLKLIFGVVSLFGTVTATANELHVGVESITMFRSQVGADIIGSHAGLKYGNPKAVLLEDELVGADNACGGKQIERGDVVFDLSIEFSGMPILGGEMVKENLVTTSLGRIEGAAKEDLAGSILHEYLPDFQMWSPQVQNALKTGVGFLVGEQGKIRRELVNQMVLSKAKETFETRSKDLILETSIQTARIFVGKKFNNGNCVMLRIGKYGFSASSPADANGNTELEGVMLTRPYAQNAVDTANTLGADLSFVQRRAVEKGYNKFSIYVFHSRPAFSSLSQFLGTAMSQSQEEFEDDRDLKSVDSVLLRGLFVRDRYDFFMSVGSFDGEFAAIVGGSYQVKPGTRAYLGYSYNSRTEATSDDSRASQAAYLYFVKDLGRDIVLKGDQAKVFAGVEGASNLVRPEISSIGEDFVMVKLGGSYKVPFRGWLKRKVETILTLSVFHEWYQRDTGNSTSDSGECGTRFGVELGCHVKF